MSCASGPARILVSNPACGSVVDEGPIILQEVGKRPFVLEEEIYDAV